MKSTPKVVLTHPIHPNVIGKLLKPKTRVVLCKNRREWMKEVEDAEALLCLLSDRIDRDALTRAKKLKAVGTYSVGMDHIDLGYCKQKKIAVVNTPGVLTRATAELTLALLFAAARRLPEGEKICRKNSFSGWAPEFLLGQELKGRRALIVGKGRIGREVSELFKAVGLKIDFVTRSDTRATLEKKLSKAQILSFHIPGTKENHHWLDAEKIELLPPDAIVLNTARGNIVDEKALINALRKKRIFAAGLDVFEQEPEIPKALRELPNVVLLPHLGSATVETRRNMAVHLVQGVLEVLNAKS